MSNNPWLGFKHSELMVHTDDLDAVQHHNATSKRNYEFLLHLAPEPWIGNLNGNLLVLYANPGATEDNVNRVLQPDHELVMQKSIRNLNQENIEYPHFHFDPELNQTEGSKWFKAKYRWLLDETSEQILAKNLVTCELAPYHSMKWKIPKRKLPTQEFTFDIIRNAILRDAVILLARTPKLWIENIPELLRYPRVFRPNSINASVSPKNYPGHFNEIIEALK